MYSLYFSVSCILELFLSFFGVHVDSDNDDGLFDGVNLAPIRKKTALQLRSTYGNYIQKHCHNVASHMFIYIQKFIVLTIEKTSLQEELTEQAEEFVPSLVTENQLLSHNYVDCTESNDEEEGDEEEEEEVGKGDMTFKKEELVKSEEKKKELSPTNPPKWEDFFTSGMLTDSQTSQSQSGCSVQSRSSSILTDSQTPELFSEEEEETTLNPTENFSLSLSASLSSHSSQNQDLSLSDTLTLHPKRGPNENCIGTNQMDSNVQQDMQELSDSQVSSDFDIPCTPESRIPQPEELLELYRKLASGEDVLIRKGSQGSV